MPKFKDYNQGQAMLLPPDIRSIIPSDHICLAINEVVDSLDISMVLSTYSNNGRYAYDPRMMIKVMFYAYTEGIRSSRKIEKMARENLVYRYLAANSSPDHGTINLFRKSHLICLEKLFAQIVVLCDRLEMINPSDVSIDGTMTKANASKKNTFNREEIAKARKRFRRMLEEAEEIDEAEDEKYGKNNRGYDQLPDHLADPEKRKKEIKRLMDKMNRLDLAEEKITEKREKVKHERAIIRNTARNNNHNIVDEDANLMKMKSSKAVTPGYNSQVAASKQVITAYDVTDEAIDEPSLLSMIGKHEKNTNEKIKTVKADAGYWSKENMEKIQEKEIDAYIPDRRKDYEENKMRDNTLNKYHRNYFRYNEKTDEFICPERKRLKLKITNRDKNGKIVNQRYFCVDCQNCRVKEKCTQAKNKQICVDWQLEEYKKAMREKLNSEAGRKKYIERMSEIETVFGNINYNQKANHFLCRGKPMVKIEFGLTCIAHNFIKITNWLKTGDNRKRFVDLMRAGALI